MSLFEGGANIVLFFDSMPIWGLLLMTIVLVVLALEIGMFVGRQRQTQAGGKAEVSGAMVGATMALLAFMLAFTFNGAAGRYEDKKALVIEETNAIYKSWRHAGFLAEPYRSDIRSMLRNYVDLRLKAATGKMELGEAIHRSDAEHDKMWALAESIDKKDAGGRGSGLFIHALDEVQDLHLKRLTVGTRSHIPPAIWATLYLLMAIAMLMMGIQVGLSGQRHVGMELALAISFSAVLFLIADLDRPQEGLINVSQQAMEELKVKISAK